MRRLDVELTPVGHEVDEVVVTGEREEERDERNIGVAKLQNALLEQLPAYHHLDFGAEISQLPVLISNLSYSLRFYRRLLPDCHPCRLSCLA